MSSVDNQKYFDFISKKFSLGHLDGEQANYLLSQITSDEIVEALEQYGLKSEFQTSTNETTILRQEQDQAYQDSLIEEHIRQLAKKLEPINQDITKFKSELEPIENAFKIALQRFEKFPENPNIQKEYETRQNEMAPLIEKMTELMKEKVIIDDEIANFAMMKTLC